MDKLHRDVDLELLLIEEEIIELENAKAKEEEAFRIRIQNSYLVHIDAKKDELALLTKMRAAGIFSYYQKKV